MNLRQEWSGLLLLGRDERALAGDALPASVSPDKHIRPVETPVRKCHTLVGAGPYAEASYHRGVSVDADLHVVVHAGGGAARLVVQTRKRLGFRQVRRRGWTRRCSRRRESARAGPRPSSRPPYTSPVRAAGVAVRQPSFARGLRRAGRARTRGRMASVSCDVSPRPTSGLAQVRIGPAWLLLSPRALGVKVC